MRIILSSVSITKNSKVKLSMKKKQLISIYFIFTIGLIVLYFFDPATSSNIYPPSLSREWGGVYCAGCGTLRALHQLLHGNWRTAFRLNPLILIFIPYFFYWIIPYFYKYFYEIKMYEIKYKKEQILMFSVITLIYGILRNTSYTALSWLVPPN